MTTEEATKFLALIKVAYPTSYRDMDRDMVLATINMWQITFSDIPYVIMEMAFEKYRRKNKFPPTVADIFESLQNVYYSAVCDANIALGCGDSEILKRCKYVISCTSHLRQYSNEDNIDYRRISNDMLLESSSGTQCLSEKTTKDKEN